MRAAVLQGGHLAVRAAEEDERLTEQGARQQLARSEFFGQTGHVPAVAQVVHAMLRSAVTGR
jgi:hypothetical protein